LIIKVSSIFIWLNFSVFQLVLVLLMPNCFSGAVWLVSRIRVLLLKQAAKLRRSKHVGNLRYAWHTASNRNHFGVHPLVIGLFSTRDRASCDFGGCWDIVYIHIFIMQVNRQTNVAISYYYIEIPKSTGTHGPCWNNLFLIMQILLHAKHFTTVLSRKIMQLENADANEDEEY
jgi:hypothetical protein